MKKYILNRLLMMIPVVLGVSILIFTLMYFVPGDLARIMLGTSATQEEVNALRESLGLNDPYFVRLVRFLKQTFIDFDLGKSYMTNVPVTEELAARFPRTLILALGSTALALLVGVPMGVMAAVHQNEPRDYITMSIALLGISMPNFWLALMLIVLFSVKLKLLPAAGIDTPAGWILPIVSNSLIGISTQARQARSSMLDVIHSDFVTTAKSKGLPRQKVIWKHALPNALIPVVTIAGGVFGNLLAGSMITESVFSIPGIGYYLISAVNNRDYTVVQSCVIVLSILFSLAILLTDILLAVIDPRIKEQFAANGNIRKMKKRVA